MQKEIEEIIEAVSEVTGVRWEQIVSRSRKRKYTDARTLITHFVYELIRRVTYTELGMLLGRDHASVIYFKKCHYNKYITDHSYRRMSDVIESKLINPPLNYDYF